MSGITFECVARAVMQSECIISGLDVDDKAETTPHDLRIEENPRANGEYVDSYAGCARGKRYVTVVKRTVAEGSATTLLGILEHEIAHHIVTNLETCKQRGPGVHGSTFETALARVSSAGDACN